MVYTCYEYIIYMQYVLIPYAPIFNSSPSSYQLQQCVPMKYYDLYTEWVCCKRKKKKGRIRNHVKTKNSNKSVRWCNLQPFPRKNSIPYFPWIFYRCVRVFAYSWINVGCVLLVLCECRTIKILAARKPQWGLNARRQEGKRAMEEKKWWIVFGGRVD